MPDLPGAEVDLLVLGRGPAGVSCALQARRDGWRVLLVGDEPVGGLVRAARRIDNLAGRPGVPGTRFAAALGRQLRTTGARSVQAGIAALRCESGWFVADGSGGFEARARAVCLATGTRPRRWLASSERAARDVRALPRELAGARVVVVGGGEAALDTALSAADRGAHVAVLVRGAQPRSAPGLLDEVLRAGLELRCGVEVEGVSGGPGAWRLACRSGGSVAAEQLVVCIGREPRDELLQGLGLEALAPSVDQPALPGLFAAGDVIRGRERYVATALGDGQRAALAAAAFLEAGRTSRP